MTKEVKYIAGEASIKETLIRMRNEKVSSFIVDRENHDDYTRQAQKTTGHIHKRGWG